jgi:hypothetical protein
MELRVGEQPASGPVELDVRVVIEGPLGLSVTGWC